MPNPETPPNTPSAPMLPGHVRIGTGRTAEVWRRGDGTVLKLFVADRPAAWIDAEAAVTAVVASLHHDGYTVPAFHGRLDHDGRQGLVLGEVSGHEMLGLLGQRPWSLVGLARHLAEVQVAVHRAGPAETVAELPSYVDRMVRQVSTVEHRLDGLGPRAIEALHRLAADVPVVLCHGDYHPGNLLVGADGTVAVIDWTNAAQGPAAMDVAMTTILLTCAEVPGSGPMRQVMVLGRRVFHAAYRRRLHRLAPDVVAQADRWLPAMAAARLADSPESEHPALLALAGRLAAQGDV